MKNPLSIEFRSTDFRLTDLLRREGRVRLESLLAPFGSRISQIQVRFIDVNGPRGGRDTTCAIQASLQGQSAIYAECQAMGPWEALWGASRRLRTLLDRVTAKSRRFVPLGT